MALSLAANHNIEVISRLDDSLIDYEDSEKFKEIYDEYLEKLDESLLEFKEGVEPTRFILRQVLDYRKALFIKNEQVKYRSVGKGKQEVDVRIGTTMMETVRAALVDIKHPEGGDPGALVFKRGSDQSANEDLMALLDAHGIVSDLYTAHQNAGGTKQVDKKKLAH